MDETNKSVKIAIIGHGHNQSILSESIFKNTAANYIESDIQSNNIYDELVYTAHVDKAKEPDLLKKAIVLVEDNQDGNIISNMLDESFRHILYSIDQNTLYAADKQSCNSGYTRPRKNQKTYF